MPLMVDVIPNPTAPTCTVDKEGTKRRVPRPTFGRIAKPMASRSAATGAFVCVSETTAWRGDTQRCDALV